jgi:hypothetical protein
MEYQKFTDIGYQNKNALTHKCSFTSCYAEINDWIDHPIRKVSNNCKTVSLFWSKHYICSSKLRYVLRVQIPASCQVQILAPAWIWTMTEAPGKRSHSPVNSEIPHLEQNKSCNASSSGRKSGTKITTILMS